MGAKRDIKTADRILDAAEKLVQVRGFNAFSYADVSKAVGIQKASLHHHFATKTDLGLALLERYRRAFLGALANIESDANQAVPRLERYVDLYRAVLRKRRMCMCGMLAADIATLPQPMRASVGIFFAENEGWLARVLTQGTTRGELQFAGTPASMAGVIVSSLEGAMLVARGRGAPSHFDDVAALLIANMRPAKTARSVKTREERKRPATR